MLPNEVHDLLSRLRDGVGQDVSLKCEHENLETVYVHLDDGGIRVDDDHKTFYYLATQDDSTYVPYESIDLAAIRREVAAFGVELIDAPPDGVPSLEYRVRPDQPIAEAVDRVAEAVDRVFNIATRPLPNWGS